MSTQTYAGRLSPTVGNGLGGLPRREETGGGLNIINSSFQTITGYTQVSPGFAVQDYDKLFISIITTHSNTTYNYLPTLS